MKTKKLYRNKEWLEGKYIEKQLSTYQIGKLYNCSYATIRNWLIKFNIPIRSKNEALHLNYIKQIGNNNYCNKNWLEKKYIKEKLSMTQIAKLCNCNFLTIWCWLKKFNILIRSINKAQHLRQGNHCNLSNEAKEWINGELLGDGSLNCRSLFSARFEYGSKYLEYINYISDILESFGIKRAGKIRKRYHKNMNCHSYHYTSLNYEELSLIYKHWYPNGKKLIPQDLELTPLIVRQWYIGDGSLICRKNRRPHIILSTCGFSIKGVKWLIKELNKLGFISMQQLSNNTIGISTYSTKKFLDYIGECPVKCYQYKWDY